jgi:peptidoglycan/LPS O-acetylase OafA/YrhL
MMAGQEAGASRHRVTFHTLDLLRGFAAVAVMLWHREVLPLSTTAAYLAVDLFFLLSDVVVAEAYGERLASGWTIGRFMLVRVVRLWPLYLLGTLVSLVAALWTIAAGSPPAFGGSLMKAVVLSVFFLPRLHQNGCLFPLNPAAWSLFAELAVNLVFALVSRAGLLRWSIVLLAVASVFLGFEVHRFIPQTGNLDVGAFAGQLAVGLARSSFSFFAGIVLHQLWRTGRLPTIAVHPLVFVLAFFMIVCLIPRHGSFAAQGAVLTVFVGFPVLVALAMAAPATGRIARWCNTSGRLSYPVYTIHLPLFALVEAIAGGADRTPTWAYYQASAAAVLLAWPLDRYVDTPVRAFLSRRLGLSRRTVAAAKPL